MLLLAALPVFASCTGSPSPTVRPSPFAGERLYADVVRYADLGTHGTASEGDRATATWLRRELEDAGLQAELQRWSFRRFVPARWQLTVEGRSVASFPFWHPAVTGPTPVTGPLVPWTGEEGEYHGGIVFVPGDTPGPPVHGRGVNPYVAAAARGGAVGLVFAVPGPPTEVVAVNARQPWVETPLPIPALIVPSGERDRLTEAAERESPVTLSVQGETVSDAEASNVVARLERGERWIVVTTPISGWFDCAGERGPGVALFLALARWAARHDGEHSYLFLGNSGHELDNLGAHRSMEAHAPPAERVDLWIHLGASIGTRAWQDTPDGLRPLPRAYPGSNLVGAPELLAPLREAFAGVSWLEPRSDGPVAGELRHFLAEGYPAFGIYGGHRFFHTRKDTPATTGPDLLEPIGAAIRAMAESMDPPN